MRIWAFDDGVKVDPVTGTAWEAQWAGGQVADGYTQKNHVWDAAARAVSLHAARNEVVAFQVIVEGPVSDLAVEASDLTGPEKIGADHLTVFRQWYVRSRVAPDAPAASQNIGDGWIPDGLVPLSAPRYGAPLSIPDPVNGIEGQRAIGLWVDLYVPADAPPGEYRGELLVRSADGREALALRLRVHDVTIPDQAHLHVDLNNYGEIENPARSATARMAYYHLAHSHRCFIGCDDAGASPFKPVFDETAGTVTDWGPFEEGFAALLDGSAFTAAHDYGPGPRTGVPVDFYFLPFGCNAPRPDSPKQYRPYAWPLPYEKMHAPDGERMWIETLRAFGRHFEQRGWTKTTCGVFLNGVDEPVGAETWDEVAYFGRLVQASGTGFLYRCDLYALAEVEKRIAGWSAQRILEGPGQAVDLFVVECGGGGRIVHDRDALAAWKAADPKRQVWTYNGQVPCTGGQSICHEAVGPRVFGWMAARYGLGGLHPTWELLWNRANAWTVQTDQSECWARFVYPEAGELGATDGHGLDVPCPSIRLKNIRRGAQDFELIHMLRAAGKPQQADTICHAVFRMALDEPYRTFGREHKQGEWSHDPAAWHTARLKLLEALAQ
jgi:hypothetical protein